MNNFRLLRADEIDCRVAQIKDNGLSLLLYKDARCDMNILDETVGPMNWRREHSRDNANCTVSIWDADKAMWISKEDTGTESNMDAQKGLASDSFKRSCFNWGIGRELYTAPFIWIKATDCEIKRKDGNSRPACYDTFAVESISYNDKSEIAELTIINCKTGRRVFSWKSGQKSAEIEPRFVCDVCGKEIKPYTDANGRTVSLRAHKERSMERFSRCLCLDCINNLYESAAH